MSDSLKTYVLDTNVLIHDPNAISSFANARIGIPAIVLEELDQFKSEPTERGRNSREVVRKLDELRSKGSLVEGVQLDNGGILQVILFEGEKGDKIGPYLLNKEDNKILHVLQGLIDKGEDVKFISKDINARVKADTLGIPTEDYLKGNVSKYDIYKGWTEVSIDSLQLKKGDPEELAFLASSGVLSVNEFVLLTSKNNPHNYKVFRYLGSNKFKEVHVPDLNWPIKPKNPQQLMTLDLLFDPAIQLVSLIGPAGTGKTFLALLAGLDQVLNKHLYEKILISRPIVPLGPDIGFLPGDIQEKLFSWMQPVYDNMNIIVRSSANNKHLENLRYENRRSNDRSAGKHRSGSDRFNNDKFNNGKRDKFSHRSNDRFDHSRRDEPGTRSLEQMINSGKISLEAITYMRGRSIPYQFILIDEVQNLTPHEVKTLVTRVGEGSKIILCGDPYQIDSPYLDFSGNGLMVASNAFKGQSIFGTVFLETSERSELSRLAGELL